MINIVMNERAYAEEAIANHSLGVKPVETIGRVARYYYSEGYKKSEIAGMLESFMLKCDPSINIVKWQSLIDYQANVSDKYDLVDVGGVSVTESEIGKIKELNGKLLQRLMFTMLCLAKYGNEISPSNNNWVNKKDKDIFSLANIAITTKRQSLMINDLWTAGYIGYSKVVDNVNLNVKIINDDSPTALFVDDFRNLGNQYLKYCGDRYIECQCCGCVVKERSAKQKYCNDCAVDIDRKKASDRYYQRREVCENTIK